MATLIVQKVKYFPFVISGIRGYPGGMRWFTGFAFRPPARHWIPGWGKWMRSATVLAVVVLACTTGGLRAQENAPASQGRYGPANENKAGKLPAYTAALADRAAKAFSLRHWDEARAAYLEMLEADPTNALVLSNLGAVEQGAGHLPKAKEYFGKAVAINPDLTQTWMAWGLVCYDLGDNYLAASALTRAIHQTPTDAKAHNYLGVVVEKLGWLDAAESELRRAIELEPGYANAHFNLALMYLDRKPPGVELARHHYERAVALGAAKDPDIEKRLLEK